MIRTLSPMLHSLFSSCALEFDCALHNLFIKRMLYAVFDGHDDGFFILLLTTLPTAVFLIFLSLTG